MQFCIHFSAEKCCPLGYWRYTNTPSEVLEHNEQSICRVQLISNVMGIVLKTQIVATKIEFFYEYSKDFGYLCAKLISQLHEKEHFLCIFYNYSCI